MDPENAFSKLAALQVLDVRQEHEFRGGLIEGARNIPLNELLDRIDEVNAHRPVLTVCRTGIRSARAAEMLRSRGIEANDLEGGMKAWERAGLPITTPSGEPGRVADEASVSPLTDAHESATPMDPSWVELQNDLIEVAFALRDRFGNREPTEEESREFMIEWLMSKGKSEAEARALLES
ncbi:MAG: rhodanese-like domain-containing protein [Actinomycetota bacterium]|nr:rhodanese-like domain-containing protein [Actinomycetota bacterium]